ncbi:MAG: AMP-binding protein [Actinomycetota bacterium]
MHAPELENMTIGDLLDRAADRFADNAALVYEDERLTFGQLAERVDETAAGLIALGVEPGDRVAMWMPNNIQWVLVYLAVARIGAALVPVNTSFRAGEAAYVVGQSDSTTLIVADRFRDKDFVALAQQLMDDDSVSLDRLIVVGEDVPEGALSWADVIERGKTVDRDVVRDRKEAVDARDVVLVLYTSGTTGFPKGAMHAHKVIRNMSDAAERMGLRADDVLVLYLPLYHVFAAFAGILGFMHVGGKVVLMNSFDARRSLELMEAEKATIVYGLSPTYHDQIEHPDYDGFDLSSVRFCLTPGTPDFVRYVRRRMGFAVNVYGMTECTSITCLPSLDDSDEITAETVGRPLQGFEAKVLDAEGNEVPPETTGELVVRGHPVMLGYYKKPEETAAVMDDDGWFRTGDAVTRTEDGYFRFLGRYKEMFRVGGENVDPVEVEVALMRHPAVSMAAVAGVEDARLGEVGVAWVQIRRGHDPTEEELIAHARTELARFKVPKHIVILDEFPKTGSGKIQKFKLTESFKETQDR